MTSLQKAAAAAGDDRTPSYETSSGRFESCFAAGLDFTEFGGNPNEANGDQTPQRSAAAELLALKKEEKRLKEEDEAADYRMNQAIQNRTIMLQRALEREESGKESNILVNALVKMHGSDTSNPSVYRKSKKLNRKSGISRCSSTPSSTVKPSKVFKKSRRSKC